MVKDLELYIFLNDVNEFEDFIYIIVYIIVVLQRGYSIVFVQGFFSNYIYFSFIVKYQLNCRVFLSVKVKFYCIGLYESVLIMNYID